MFATLPLSLRPADLGHPADRLDGPGRLIIPGPTRGIPRPDDAKMIEHFSVKNYKCLADVGIPLTPIHVLIGQNDSGKTSLLEAMLALSRSNKEPLDQAFPGDWRGLDLVYEGATGSVVELTARLSGSRRWGASVTYHLGVEFFNVGMRVCRRIEEWYENEQRLPISEYRRGWTGLSTRGEWKPGPDNQRDLHSIDMRLSSAGLFRLDPQQMALPTVIDTSRIFRIYPDGFGLATLLNDIIEWDPSGFHELCQEFCKFFPQFRSIRVETQPAVARRVLINDQCITENGIGKGIVFETTQGRAIRAQQASDGAILFLGLLALFHSQVAPKLLLIEEPEKGVYPKRLEEIVQLIRNFQSKASGQNVPQIIMTTHSPYLLTSFSPEEVTLMVRDGESGSVRARPLRDAPNIEERLGHGEFYLGELWYNLTEAELFADA